MATQDVLIILLDMIVFLAAGVMVYLITKFRNASGSGSLWRMSTAMLLGTMFFVIPFSLEFIHTTGIQTVSVIALEHLRRLFELIMFVATGFFALFSYRELYKAGGVKNDS